MNKGQAEIIRSLYLSVGILVEAPALDEVASQPFKRKGSEAPTSRVS